MFGGRGLRSSYPVIVNGVSPGYSFETATELAADRLNRLCVVMSIASDTLWQVRHAPQSLRFDSNVEYTAPGIPDMSDPNGLPPHELTVPPWAEKALELHVSEGDLLQAARAHHQGMALEKTFPSYALLAYVAALEGIGARYEALQRCQCCNQCSATIGLGKRFRAALKLGTSPEIAEYLADVYKRRSLTAHEGRLHGGETLRGAHLMRGRLFAVEDTAVFKGTQARLLRDASRNLLISAVTGTLPEATTSP